MRTSLSLTVLLTALLGACVPRGADSPPDTSEAARQIIAGAARATGSADYGDLLQLTTDATVTGPTDTFRTVIHSSSDGRVRMEQIPFDFLAGSGGGEGWLVDPATGAVTDLGPAATFVLGHEVHLLALRPLSRLANPRLAAPHPDDPSGALGVALSLTNGDSIVAYFSASDSLPVGLRVAYTDPAVVVAWSDWVDRDGVRVFRTAEFRQGEETFRYAYDTVAVGPLPDSLFDPPREGLARE